MSPNATDPAGITVGRHRRGRRAGVAAGEESTEDVYWLSVRSTPSGAEVLIDGQVEGKTPFQRRIFDPTRSYTLLVRKGGFTSTERTVSGTSEWSKRGNVRTLTVTAKLDPIPASPDLPATVPPPLTATARGRAQGQSVRRARQRAASAGRAAVTPRLLGGLLAPAFALGDGDRMSARGRLQEHDAKIDRLRRRRPGAGCPASTCTPTSIPPASPAPWR